jgi:hypothetical protein
LGKKIKRILFIQVQKSRSNESAQHIWLSMTYDVSAYFILTKNFII